MNLNGMMLLPPCFKACFNEQCCSLPNIILKILPEWFCCRPIKLDNYFAFALKVP